MEQKVKVPPLCHVCGFTGGSSIRVAMELITALHFVGGSPPPPEECVAATARSGKAETQKLLPKGKQAARLVCWENEK